MNDENSQQYLIKKKISQLVKLINHFENINAEREFDIFSLNKEFDDDFCQFQRQHRQSIQNLYDRCDLIHINIENLIKNEYIDHLQKLNQDYSNDLVETNKKVAEIDSNIKLNTSKFLDFINSINYNIDLFFQKTVSFEDQQIENIKTQIEKLNEKYKKEVTLINSELNEKTKNFEKESQQKFEELEKNFKNSIQQLKLSSNQSDEANTKKSLNEMKIQLNQIKTTIEDLKEEFQFKLQIQNLKESFKQENDDLTKKLEKDLINTKKQCKLMITSVSDTHRNEIFIKNNEIARIYDSEIKKIRQQNQQNDYEKEINLFYEKKIDELEKELNTTIENTSSSLLVNSNDNDDIDKLNKVIQKLNKLKIKKIENINRERNEINDLFLSQKEKEISRHLQKMSDDKTIISEKYNELNEELNKIKNEFHSQFEKLDSSIKELQNLLEKEKLKQSTDLIEINATFDRNEKELRTVYLKLKNYSEKLNSHKNTIHENKEEIIHQQMNEMNEKINKLKQTIQNKSAEKSYLIEESTKNAKNKRIEIQEKAKKQKNQLEKSHKDTINKLQSNHTEKVNDLFNQISIQKESNKNDQLQNENEIKESPINLNKKLELFEATIINDINKHKAIQKLKIHELDKMIDEMKTKKSFLIVSCNKDTMRKEEHLIIEKLENELFFVEQHLKDLSLDLANYKKKIVSQEGTYNSQFGTTPAVAVLRPKTGYGQIGIKGPFRPNTTLNINRSKSLLKNHPNKPIVHF